MVIALCQLPATPPRGTMATVPLFPFSFLEEGRSMTCTVRRWIVLATGALLLAVQAPAGASAQAPDRSYYGPYSVYGPGLTYVQRPAVSPISSTFLRAQTSVSVPDGGT